MCGNKDSGKSGNSKRRKGNKGNKVNKKKGESVSTNTAAGGGGGNKKGGSNTTKRTGGGKKNAANDMSEMKSALDEMSSANASALQHDINVLRQKILHRLTCSNTQPMTNHLTRLINHAQYSGITANGTDVDDEQITLSHTCAAALSLM